MQAQAYVETTVADVGQARIVLQDCTSHAPLIALQLDGELIPFGFRASL